MTVSAEERDQTVERPKAARIPRGTVAVIAIALLAVATGFLLPRFVPMLGWTENWVKDIRISLFPPALQPVRQDMAILAITEETLGTLRYRSPVDRAFLARLLDKLAKANVRAVVFDILFDRETEPEKDKLFREKLIGFPKPMIVVWGDPPKETAAGTVEVRDAYASVPVTPEQAAFMRDYTEGVTRGYANLIRDDNDGTVRWVNILHREPAPPIRGFGDLADKILVELGLRKPAPRQALGPGLPAAVVRALGLPVPEADSLPLDYALGPDDKTPAIPSFAAHLAPVLPDAFFAGKIIFIGADLPDTDRYRTPFAAGLGVARGVIPGVTIHAHAVAQLLDGRRLKEVGPQYEILIIALTVLIGVAIAARDLKVGRKLALATVALLVVWFVLFSTYPYSGWLLPFISPTLGFAVAVTGISFYQQRRYMEERTFIRGALSRYVPEDVVRQLEAEPWRLKLGGERRELTYLFTDIAGFTTLAERSEPALLVAALNEYLDGATKVVLAHHGAIDKYIGDAVVAVFGAFDDTGRHASEAAACALALDRFASDFAARQKTERGLDFGITRIGVNSGFAIVGNFGGEARFDYTAIGDTVNTAARLEGANKYLGTRICVSETTVALAPDTRFRPIGELQVKGKDEYVTVYEPLADGDPRAAYLDRYLQAFARAEADAPSALAAIEDLLARPEAAGDHLLEMHRDRLLAMLKMPRRRKSDTQLGTRWTEIVLTEK